VVLITIILLAACAATVIVLFRRLRQREPAPLDRLVEEAQGALKELRSGADLRDTISRCYAEMMRVISEQQGVNRDPSLTPREFEQRLAAVGLGDMHIRRLTRLFERVRYSPHPPGPPEEHEAEECLAAIIASHHTRRPLR
jgi:hypothetical protein